MSIHFPHPLKRASDVRATGGSVQSWKRRGSYSAMALDDKLHRAVSPGMRQVVMVVGVVVPAKTNNSWKQETKRQHAS